MAEVLHGAVDEKDADRIVASLSAFDFIPFPDSMWNSTGRLLMKLRSSGIRVPFQDVMIASLCVHFGIRIWTRDKHFQSIQSIDARLNLL